MAKKKEHQLTKKELERSAKIDRIVAEYEAAGYVRKDQTISILFANVMAFVLSIPFILIFGFLFIMKNGTHIYISMGAYLLFLLITILFVVVHELIHGLVWGLCAPSGFKTIEFGIMKENLTPYCTCGEPLSKKSYILGAIMPCVVLGILPSIVAIFIDSTMWLVVGFMMFMGAGGDLTIILKMLAYRSEAEDMIIMDHPSECGFFVLEKM